MLVAIDDVQWVDLASRRALEFAARRLPAQLRLFVTRRSEGAADVPLELDRALPPDAFNRVVLGSLSLASLHHIVRERLGTSPTRPVIARIAEASGGNPFFAIEIARAIGGRAAGPGEVDPLPVPQSVQKLAAERVNALSGAAREAVLVAASLSRPTADAVVTALPDEPDGGTAIAEAEDAGVLVIEHGRIRFTHPLLASAVYASVSEARRRALHRRLAEVVSDAEERARRLSQSLTDADESVAIRIEGAARQAVLRGAADAFAQAAAIFERLGAEAWTERARTELDVVGPRRRAPDELTATEQRVAELAAAGTTNREIARAVFMSEKTVEAHIARVYRKLGIHSRAELGARMAGNPASSQERT